MTTSELPRTMTSVPPLPDTTAPFLSSLWTILHSEDTSVVSWCKDGRAFAIHDCGAMESDILPRHFRHGNLASFQRQLNYFGFRKLQSMVGVSNNVYCSPHFQRHNPACIAHIKRKTYRSKASPHLPLKITRRSSAHLWLASPNGGEWRGHSNCWDDPMAPLIKPESLALLWGTTEPGASHDEETSPRGIDMFQPLVNVGDEEWSHTPLHPHEALMLTADDLDLLSCFGMDD
ncbi:Aste57867_2587 [Aphanomyces stellatus]|uniref:Aste57867_2587 protein n=1 Tax=Aphanomyces stellatus TaxID=120398 RepID=A0A485K9I5_9STRA|nr:hypothetical protein As57867_002580 [Aphanomyces stellatus]VFT79783.1 Aste57867_2587 [Aphanomyces stellatus]